MHDHDCLLDTPIDNISMSCTIDFLCAVADGIFWWEMLKNSYITRALTS
jgi:hypothetical protein